MSFIKDIEDKVKLLTNSVTQINYQINDISMLYFSQGKVTSVNEDLTHCDVLILDKSNVILKNVISTIPVYELNLVGHLSTDDVVLVGYNYNFQGPFILKKISTSSIDKEYAINLTNRIDLSTLTI